MEGGDEWGREIEIESEQEREREMQRDVGALPWFSEY